MENTERNYELEKAIREKKAKDDAKKMADDLTNFLNGYSYAERAKLFNEAMYKQHPTLQQNFTRLIMAWIEFCASPEYKPDARNEDSQRTCQALIEGFTRVQADKGYTGETLTFMGKPSGHLGTV